jgi:hypothetical protein
MDNATTSVNINDSEENHLPAAKRKRNAKNFTKSPFILNLVVDILRFTSW